MDGVGKASIQTSPETTLRGWQLALMRTTHTESGRPKGTADDFVSLVLNYLLDPNHADMIASACRSATKGQRQVILIADTSKQRMTAVLSPEDVTKKLNGVLRDPLPLLASVNDSMDHDDGRFAVVLYHTVQASPVDRTASCWFRLPFPAPRSNDQTPNTDNNIWHDVVRQVSNRILNRQSVLL